MLNPLIDQLLNCVFRNYLSTLEMSHVSNGLILSLSPARLSYAEFELLLYVILEALVIIRIPDSNICVVSIFFLKPIVVLIVVSKGV